MLWDNAVMTPEGHLMIPTTQSCGGKKKDTEICCVCHWTPDDRLLLIPPCRLLPHELRNRTEKRSEALNNVRLQNLHKEAVFFADRLRMLMENSAALGAPWNASSHLSAVSEFMDLLCEIHTGVVGIPYILRSNRVIQYTGDNLREVLAFAGKSPLWEKKFSSFEEYQATVNKSSLKTFHLYNTADVLTFEAVPGDWLVRCGDNVIGISEAAFSTMFFGTSN